MMKWSGSHHAEGRLYYTFKDPGAGAAYQDGKLYVNEKSGKLFKEGDYLGPYVVTLRL